MKKKEAMKIFNEGVDLALEIDKNLNEINKKIEYTNKKTKYYTEFFGFSAIMILMFLFFGNLLTNVKEKFNKEMFELFSYSMIGSVLLIIIFIMGLCLFAVHCEIQKLNKKN